MFIVHCKRQIAALRLPIGRQASLTADKLAMTGFVLSSVRVKCRQAFSIENRVLLDSILLHFVMQNHLPAGRQARSDGLTTVHCKKQIAALCLPDGKASSQ
ncbi:hypothetical protein DHD05_11345 [Arenibacter sp. N53]|nr:hypothetical protein [Arenibacter sp. N53]